MYFGILAVIFISIAIIAWLYAVIAENKERSGYGTVGKMLLALTFLSGAAFLATMFVVSPAYGCIEKVYEEPEITMSTEIPLTTFKNTDYYLIKEDGKYRYCCKAVTNNDNGSKAEISKCKITYSDEAPSLTTKEIAREWRSEWLFMYDSGTEEKTVYYFTIPSKNSILDLDES